MAVRTYQLSSTRMHRNICLLQTRSAEQGSPHRVTASIRGPPGDKVLFASNRAGYNSPMTLGRFPRQALGGFFAFLAVLPSTISRVCSQKPASARSVWAEVDGTP